MCIFRELNQIHFVSNYSKSLKIFLLSAFKLDIIYKFRT